jgi:hypothetical protein
MDQKTFSNRSNAKRAAEKMLVDGTALSVDYGFKQCEDGRFQIVWKTAPEEQSSAPGTATTDQIETEIATASASADEPVGQRHDDVQPAPDTVAEPESDPFPVGTWVKVRKGKRNAIVAQVTQRIDAGTWRVHPFGKPAEWTQLATAEKLSRTEEPAAEAPKPERSRRKTATTSLPGKPSRSQYGIDADMVAAGKVPATAPVVTSKTNPHYQKKFDALHGFAVAGDWDAVRAYKVTGSNSYSKMVERYRQDLLAVHKVQDATEAKEAAQ